MREGERERNRPRRSAERRGKPRLVAASVDGGGRETGGGTETGGGRDAKLAPGSPDLQPGGDAHSSYGFWLRGLRVEMQECSRWADT